MIYQGTSAIIHTYSDEHDVMFFHSLGGLAFKCQIRQVLISFLSILSFFFWNKTDTWTHVVKTACFDINAQH